MVSKIRICTDKSVHLATLLRALGKSVDSRTRPVSSQAILVQDSRQMHSARVYSRHKPGIKGSEVAYLVTQNLVPDVRRLCFYTQPYLDPPLLSHLWEHFLSRKIKDFLEGLSANGDLTMLKFKTGGVDLVNFLNICVPNRSKKFPCQIYRNGNKLRQTFFWGGGQDGTII